MNYQTLKDCEGVELESGKPFGFACCECGLVLDVVIVSADDKPVGFAVKRNAQATSERRQALHHAPETVRDQALEEAAIAVADHQRRGYEWVPGSLWDSLTLQATARIRALKSKPESLV